eukprot:764506-Hanusia_phi.AAC.9
MNLCAKEMVIKATKRGGTGGEHEGTGGEDEGLKRMLEQEGNGGEEDEGESQEGGQDKGKVDVVRGRKEEGLDLEGWGSKKSKRGCRSTWGGAFPGGWASLRQQKFR